MKHIAGFFLALACLTGVVRAQVAPADTSYWKSGGMGTLTFSEVGLFNWSAGGQSNMTLIGAMNLFSNYKKGGIYGDNSLDLAYGFIKNNFIFDPKAPIVKAEDKIDLNAKWGKRAWSERVHYSGLFNFRSQFAPGYANPYDSVYISRFLAPAYLQVAVGLDMKPNDWLSIFASPVSGKFTYVGDDSLAAAGSFGVNQFDAAGNARPGSGKSFRAEFGATFRAVIKRDIAKNIGLESRLDLFSNYIDRPQNIDVRWTNAVLAKINKYIVCSLNTDLIYDHDVLIPIVDSKGAPVLLADGKPKKGPRVQFKQVFGLGFSYKF